MEGRLYTYDPKHRLVTFVSGAGPNVVVFVGGLTDGFNATPYVGALASSLRATGQWCLAQTQLRSSYLGYGVHTLDDDAADLDRLVTFLRDTGFARVVLMGHSTGCQDIVHLMRVSVAAREAVAGCVLQAPVSDREFAATQPETAKWTAVARGMADEGSLDELMPRAADEAPITARRFLSLNAPGGQDDMFSSDLTRARLSCRDLRLRPLTCALRRLARPCPSRRRRGPRAPERSRGAHPLRGLPRGRVCTAPRRLRRADGAASRSDARPGLHASTAGRRSRSVRTAGGSGGAR